jgi:hypothetical protein
MTNSRFGPATERRRRAPNHQRGFRRTYFLAGALGAADRLAITKGAYRSSALDELLQTESFVQLANQNQTAIGSHSRLALQIFNKSPHCEMLA